MEQIQVTFLFFSSPIAEIDVPRLLDQPTRFRLMELYKSRSKHMILTVDPSNLMIYGFIHWKPRIRLQACVRILGEEADLLPTPRTHFREELAAFVDQHWSDPGIYEFGNESTRRRFPSTYLDEWKQEARLQQRKKPRSLAEARFVDFKKTATL